MYKHGLKRVIDFILVFIVLVVIWPILLLITIWLHFANKGAGAFFTQERPGKDGKIFRVIKFKSMTDERDAEGKLLPDAKRLTHVGKFVRATSIDELPQFWNVLKGDMSLVGTRPPTVDEFEQYEAKHKCRLSMTPGLTGMWQISGRSDIKDFDEVVRLDMEYIDNWNILKDIKILFKTVAVVFFGKGSR